MRSSPRRESRSPSSVAGGSAAWTSSAQPAIASPAKSPTITSFDRDRTSRSCSAAAAVPVRITSSSGRPAPSESVTSSAWTVPATIAKGRSYTTARIITTSSVPKVPEP